MKDVNLLKIMNSEKEKNILNVVFILDFLHFSPTAISSTVTLFQLYHNYKSISRSPVMPPHEVTEISEEVFNL